jgi:hypothetical protein
MQQGGVITAKGFDSQQLTDVMELWRATRTTRIMGGELVAINEEVA